MNTRRQPRVSQPDVIEKLARLAVFEFQVLVRKVHAFGRARQPPAARAPETGALLRLSRLTNAVTRMFECRDVPLFRYSAVP